MHDPVASLREIYPGLYLVSAPCAASPDLDVNQLWAYFLDSNSGSPPPSALTLQQSWESRSGWYLFAAHQVDEAEAPSLISAIEANYKLPTTGGAAHTTLWLSEIDVGTALDQIAMQLIGTMHFTDTTAELVWSGFCLEMSASIAVNLVQAHGHAALRFTASPSDNDLVNLYYEQVLQTVGYRQDGWCIDLYLDGPRVGSVNFGVGLDPAQLAMSFGCNFSYTVDQFNPTLLQFPLYLLGEPAANYFVAFSVWLNPLLPLHACATRFEIDTTGRIGAIAWTNYANALRSNYFFSNDGVTLQLCPIDPYQQGMPSITAVGAGFAFSQRPSQASPGVCELYLSPIGEYRVDRLASDATTGTTILQIMPGLFTREYFRVHRGERIRCINHLPAYAAAYSLRSSPQPPAAEFVPMLTIGFTTSWVAWLPLTDGGQYFGQPSSASFFGEVDGQEFPIAIDVLLAEFTDSVAIPWVPYGGVYDPVLGQGLSADDFNRFESTVLGATRHALMTQGSTGPLFFPQDASSPSPTLLSATNPQGVLVDVNVDGSWNSLTLAMEEAHIDASPPIPATCLKFLPSGSPPRLPSDLALILTQNQLFYVVTKPGPDWHFLATTFVGGFEFDLTLDADGSAGLHERTIMMFKFNTTSSVADLVSSPALWTQAAHYNHDPVAVAQVLRASLAFAQAQSSAPGKPFENFNRIVGDPGWTGTLFFNAKINGNGMPTDLQMLLGGVNGGLRAHHIGIQANLFDHTASPPRLRIKKSSLFGAIFYNGAAHPPSPDISNDTVDYEVEKLIVVFSNSAIAQFNTTVGLTLNSLFGRRVQKRAGSLATSPDIKSNTLSIKGQYQAGSDGVGRVTFSSTEQFVYEVQAATEHATVVLDYASFDQAVLVPISSMPDPKTGDAVVQARFALSGTLYFRRDPFPHSEGLDLFSYGVAEEGGGLPIADLAVNIRFTLGADGTAQPGSKTVALDMSALTAAPTNAGIRPNSLLYSIPLKFTRFLSAASGHPLNASSLGATSVNILQLEAPSAAIAGSPAASALPTSYMTGSALYGLEYDMLLGSLGALGANAKLTAKVILAWGPSSTVPDNDAAALFVQLPQLSAGAGGFALEGILKTTFGDANLLKVDLDNGQQTVYAFLFNNIQLSVFGYRFPPGVLIDFVVFAGGVTPGTLAPTHGNNLAWFLSAQPQQASP